MNNLNNENHYDLSPSQQRFWLMSKYYNQHDVYNMSLGLFINSELNFEQLKNALMKIIKSQPLLRIFINDGASEPKQKLLSEEGFQLPLVYLEELTNIDKLVGITTSLLQKPFDLNMGPLWRVAVIKLAKNKYYLFTVMHHIICDAWSFEIFYKELAYYYETDSDCTPNNYYLTKFVNNKLNIDSSNHFYQRAIAYWDGYLHGCNPALELPSDKGKKTAITKKSACSYHILGKDSYDKIIAYATKEKYSIFTLLLTAYVLILYRLTAQNDLIVGTMVSGRTDNEQNNVLGCFANMLPLRFKILNESISDFTRKVQETLYDVFEYQDLPYQEIVSIYRKTVGASEFDLIQTLFVFQNSLGDFNQLFLSNNTYIDGREPSRATTEHSLFFLLREANGELFINIQYDSDFFSPEMIAILGNTYQSMLTVLLDSPETMLYEIRRPFQDELSIINHANKTKKIFNFNTHFLRFFSEQVKNIPKSNALFTTKSFTYEKIDAESDKIALMLIKKDISKNNVVALCLPRNEQLIVALLAILKLGAIYLPLDPKHESHRINKIIDLATPKVIICNTATKNLFDGVIANLANLDEVIDNNKSIDVPKISINESDPVYLLFTSGSTGEPKPALIFQRNLTNLIFWAKDFFTKDELSSFFAGSSVNFDASILEILIPLALGGEVILAEDILHYHDIIKHKSINTLTGTPSGIASILKYSELHNSVKTVFLSGEPLPSDLLQKLFSNKSLKRAINGYGLTELTAYSIIDCYYKPVDNVSIGFPISNTEAFITDENRALLPIGAIGEICIAGEGLPPNDSQSFIKYLDTRFVDDKFKISNFKQLFTTGDYGQVLPNGSIKCLGRKDGQLKLRGYRIEKIEIEITIRTYKNIDNAAVTVQEIEKIGMVLIAYYTVLSNEVIDENLLRRYLEKKLPAYMIPNYFVPIDKIPKNLSGKVDYKKLPNFNMQDRVQMEKGKNLYVSLVISIWEEILGIKGIVSTDSFFLLGGNSLLTPLLKQAFEKKMGFNIPIVDFFMYSTVQEFSQYLQYKHTKNSEYKVKRFINKNQVSDFNSNDDIAIIGCACRLPQINSMSEFWSILCEEKSLITEVPHDRWDWKSIQNLHSDLLSLNNPCRWGAFIKDVDLFEPQFFNLSQREAKYMDPQQRLLLESAWLCFESAGYTLNSIAENKEKVGVFIGASIADYSYLLTQNKQSLDVHYATGNALSILANRISYILGLSGSSLTIDTACSSSLTALHYALASLKLGENDLALVGSAALLLLPDNYIVWNKMGIVANGPANATFDESASGFLPGDAVASILLKPAKKAIEDNDNIWGIIKSSAINHDGASKVGINAVSPKSQKELIIEAYKSANLDVNCADYIEAHGTGTELGDPIELAGIIAAMEDGDKKIPIGAVKTITGHTGPVSGLIGLLKVLLCFNKGYLTPTKVNKINPKIDLKEKPIYINQFLTPWNTDKTKIASISSFGFGGSNAHVVIEEYNLPVNGETANLNSEIIFILSAKTMPSLRKLAENYINYFETSDPEKLLDTCYTLSIGRTIFEHRLAIIVKTPVDIILGLKYFLQDHQILSNENLYSSKYARQLYTHHLDEVTFLNDVDQLCFDCSKNINIDLKHIVNREIADKYSYGDNINWKSYWNFFFPNRRFYKQHLLNYPFNKQHCWFDIAYSKQSLIDKKTCSEKSLFYKVNLEEVDLILPSGITNKQTYLLFHDIYGIADIIKNNNISDSISIYKGNFFDHAIQNKSFLINPKDINDYLHVYSSIPEDVAYTFIYCFTVRPFISPNVDNLIEDINLVKNLFVSIEKAQIKIKSFRFFTTNVYDKSNLDNSLSANQMGLNALVKTLMLEHPKIQFQIIDILAEQISNNQTEALKAIFSQKVMSKEIILRENKVFVPKLIISNPIESSDKKINIKKYGRYIITGGMGHLGSILARWLIDNYQVEVVLLTRNTTNKSMAEDLKIHNNYSEKINIIECDVSKKDSVDNLLNALKNHNQKIDGVFHLAGVLKKERFVEKTDASIYEVLAPKVIGATNIIDAFEQQHTDFIVFFSSLASFYGKTLSADYAAANAYLNGLSTCYKSKNIYSLALCGISDVGMEIDQHGSKIEISDENMNLIDSSTFIKVIESYLKRSNQPVIYIQPRIQKDVVHSSVSINEKIKFSIEDIIKIISVVTELDVHHIERNNSLIQLGVDSILAVKLIAKINQDFNIFLSPTIVFQASSVDDFYNLIIQSQPEIEIKNEITHHEANKQKQFDVNQPLISISQSKEDIAIIGLSCLLPEARDEGEFWNNLKNSRDSVITISGTELNEINQADNQGNHRYSRDSFSGGFLNYDLGFDPLFFQISPQEGENMSFEQKLILQLTHSALENAGYAKLGEINSNVGVYIAAMENIFAKYDSFNAYTLLGNSLALYANRISYLYNFKGPSITLNTLCSSSLVALNAAVAALRNGEIDYAIVGGIRGGVPINYYKSAMEMQAISLSGKCKSFSDEADGFVPGEGGAVVLLKRLSDSCKHNDSIWGVIRGSAINHCGRHGGLTIPTVKAQAEVIKKAMKDANVNAEDISYIETHGTGTLLGDPIEISGLCEAFAGSSKNNYCAIGSVKTNIGHLEPAAGIVSLIKVLLAMKHDLLPKSLHSNTINRHVNINKTPFYLLQQAKQWGGNNKPKIAGISSFGISGTNGHLIIQDFPNKNNLIKNLPWNKNIFVFSAHTQAALERLIEKYITYFEDSSVLLHDIAYTLQIGRIHYRFRTSVKAEDKQSLLKSLREKVVFADINQTSKVKKIMIFTGQGSHYIGMGKQLYNCFSEFRKHFDQCDALLAKEFGFSIAEKLDNKKFSEINDTYYAQPFIFVLEYCLNKLLESWGIRPDLVIGHSLGEYVAACVAGVYTLEESLEIIAYRARLMQALKRNGAMTVVIASAEEISKLLTNNDIKLSIAAKNSALNTTVSGLATEIEKFEKVLINNNIIFHRLLVSHAFHSPLMEPMIESYRNFLQKYTTKQLTIPMMSNLTGTIIENSDQQINADYWINHLLSTVLFEESIKNIPSIDQCISIEIGPNAVLSKIIKEISNPNITVCFSTLIPGKSEIEQLLLLAGQLYTMIKDVNYRKVYDDYHLQKIHLPSYQFSYTPILGNQIQTQPKTTAGVPV